ncbi:hypothetical protein AAFH68_45480 [Flavobacterium sp. CGRL1]
MTTLKAGDKAPSFSGTDQDGKTHKLADYAGKKLVVFFLSKSKHAWMYSRSLRFER